MASTLKLTLIIALIAGAYVIGQNHTRAKAELNYVADKLECVVEYEVRSDNALMYKVCEVQAQAKKIL